MSCRSLAILVTLLSSAYIPVAEAQSVYVAPGGVYVGAGAGPVYVTPVPPNSVAPYEAPPYAPPAYLAPPYGAPRYEMAPSVYGDTEGVYADPYANYGSRRPVYGGRARVYGVPADYATQAAPRPPAAIPNWNARCAYNGRWEYCR
jgi:hypothetical protein